LSKKFSKTLQYGILTGVVFMGTSLFSTASVAQCIFGLLFKNEKKCYIIKDFSGDIGACHEDAQNYKGSQGASSVEMFYGGRNGSIGTYAEWCNREKEPKCPSTSNIELSKEDPGFRPYQ
jgi:hypothetical protein